MRNAEQVTFGGSGLDRAQLMRKETEALALAYPDAPVLAFWRGRPLVGGPADAAHLIWLRGSHPLVAKADPVLLGRDEGQLHFAADVSTSMAAGTISSGPFDTDRQSHPDLPDDLGFADLRSLMTQLTPRQAELAIIGKALIEWHRIHGFCAACGTASVMTHAGWQRDCPACAAPHFPRTDPVVIVLVTHGNRVLLGRSPGWPERMYSLLAGFIEPGESVEAAARREVHEESGIQLGAVSYLASQPWPFPASLMIGCRAEALNDDITLDPLELEDALWLSREELAQAFAGDHPQVMPARRGSIAQFILNAWLADRLD
ncbi:NAD(+) diphosphatase [Xinfangfangia sp. CPCC 101601]|uniref:NAD(+) diphosphatase n=1 Tax=Pseudogemmobacter lacusdianii TaxID=3069608 RepID=A0ABU0VYI9_9RHOB|nr:NAD(+) diphosphatase [Xinfangfangia sp. CPCC 101601]MDQ2066821.1 NAD(+) diphosphatase [Xinfangfangia sp. CPCC 101601]